jgi:hypothetical protein
MNLCDSRATTSERVVSLLKVHSQCSGLSDLGIGIAFTVAY